MYSRRPEHKIRILALVGTYRTARAHRDTGSLLRHAPTQDDQKTQTISEIVPACMLEDHASRRAHPSFSFFRCDTNPSMAGIHKVHTRSIGGRLTKCLFGRLCADRREGSGKTTLKSCSDSW
jgi:hypothetical protein